jgi:hypothetical protein
MADLPISALRTPGVALQWYEGVAIVAELAEALAGAATPLALPGPEHLSLTVEGRVVAAITPAASAAESVKGLGALLDDLLEGTAAPAALRVLAIDAVAGAPDCVDIEAFARALAFFERPGRRGVLASLARRAREASAQVVVESEVQRLMMRARETAHAPVRAEAPGTPPAPPRPRVRPGAITIGVLAGVLGAAVAASVILAQRGSGEAGTLMRHAQGQITSLVQSGLHKLTPVRRAAPEPAAQPPAGASAGRRPSATAARPTAARGAPTPPADAPVASGIAGSEPAAVWHVEKMGGAAAAAEDDLPPPAGASRIYSVEDADVEPPHLLRQHLPTRPPPGLDLGEVGVLEILVNEDGEVEGFRPPAPPTRFQERMIVAAAKTWRFTPAVRDGVPVKYRTRVRLTL